METQPQHPKDRAIQPLIDAIAEVRNSLRFFGEMGAREVDCTQQSLKRVLAWGEKPAAFQAETRTLEKIRIDLGDCKRCRLWEHRSRIVYGAGDPRARLVFIGEGPGHDEDRQGEPFVGAAGQLLTRIIHAIRLTREAVYICNIIKCRPPGNRNPLPDEIRTCYPFLQRQISVIGPEFICALGSIAAQTLLDTRLPISKLRGKFYSYHDIQLIPTYHPAFLLRNPEKKRDVWEDMKRLMKEMAERPWYTTK